MIELIDGYIIVAGDNDYTLKKATGGKDKDGNTIYRTVGYYSSISRAIKGCYSDLSREVIKGKAYTLKEAVQALESLEARFEEIMPRVLK
jgi:hypothetical protein